MTVDPVGRWHREHPRAGSGSTLALSRRGRQRRVEAALPDVIDELARSLGSGQTIRRALIDAVAHAGPLSARLAMTGTALERGHSVTAAIGHLGRGIDTRTMHMVLTMIELVDAHPAGGSAALRSVAASIRAEAELGREVAVLTTQAEASARVLTGLPLVVVVLSSVQGGRLSSLLWATTVGRICLGVSCGLVAIGWWWMRAMIRAVVPT